MARITPRLLTSECAAHYPRLWGLIEALSNTQVPRRYPVALDMVNFCQQFELWVATMTDHIGQTLDMQPPHRVGDWTGYGADPLVGERLDFLADTIGAFATEQPEIAKTMMYDLADWHNAILMRTQGPGIPRYMTSIKCPECGEYSVLKHGQGYFCGNADCCHEWVKGGQAAQG